MFLALSFPFRFQQVPPETKAGLGSGGDVQQQ